MKDKNSNNKVQIRSLTIFFKNDLYAKCVHSSSKSMHPTTNRTIQA